MPVTGSKDATSSARKRSIQSIKRRLSQRSTNTPATAPIKIMGSVCATRMPLTASGAHGSCRARTAAIQRSRVKSKTVSPRRDIACPSQSSTKLRLDNKAVVGEVGDDVVEFIGLLLRML